jgi:O-antigen/teichoic acid export membrane protein
MLNLWFKGIEKVSLIVLPLTLFFIAAGYDFITLVFGANYEQAVLPFQIYSLTVLMRVTSYASILQAFGDTKGIMRMSVHLMFWKILLGILGTMYFGIIGTAASSVIAHYINWHAWLKRIGTHMELPWYRVLPFAAYGRILGLSTVLAILIYSLSLVVEMHSVTALALNLVLYIILFLSVGRLTHIVSSEDLTRLRSFLRLQFLFKS